MFHVEHGTVGEVSEKLLSETRCSTWNTASCLITGSARPPLGAFDPAGGGRVDRRRGHRGVAHGRHRGANWFPHRRPAQGPLGVLSPHDGRLDRSVPAASTHRRGYCEASPTVPPEPSDF